jgi:hypothetical protein
MNYLFFVFIALSQLLNSLLGGWPDESTSARSYRMRESLFWGFMYRAINVLFFWQKDHCKWAYELETVARPVPPEQRSLDAFKELVK